MNASGPQDPVLAQPLEMAVLASRSLPAMGRTMGFVTCVNGLGHPYGDQTKPRDLVVRTIDELTSLDGRYARTISAVDLNVVPARFWALRS